MHAIIKMLHLTSRRSTELLVQGNDVLSWAQYGVRRSDIIQIPRTYPVRLQRGRTSPGWRPFQFQPTGYRCVASKEHIPLSPKEP